MIVYREYHIDTDNVSQTKLLKEKVLIKINELHEQRNELELVLTELNEIQDKCTQALNKSS